MITKLRNNLPALRNQKGFTLIELMVTLAIVCILAPVIIGLIVGGIFFFSSPDYGAKAYVMDGNTKIYKAVMLPDEGKVKGVCAGLAYRLGIDPIIPRGFFVIFTLAGGSGILLYFLCWLFMDSAYTPEDFNSRTMG